MKVLWFSSSPCSSAERGVTGQALFGGWLVSLERELRTVPEIQLEIAFLSPENDVEDEFDYRGVRYYAIQPYRSCCYWGFRMARRFMSQARQEERICSRMIDIVERSRPDIIHIHGTERPFGMIAGHVKDIPVVYSIQGFITACAEKYYSGISLESVRKYERLSDRIRKKSIVRDYKTFVHNAENERRFLSEAKYVAGRTAWDKSMTELFNPARRYFHIDEIMRNPFYASGWSKSSFGKAVQFVSVFSFGLYKGFETLLRTAKCLKDNAKFDFAWTVIGYGGDENYVKIAEQVTHVSAKEAGVTFVGRKTADAMVDIMLGADIFCHFSHIENSPNAVCEAMLLGMPVVATNVGGTSTMVDNGSEGILVPDGDSCAFAGALERLVVDFPNAAAMGAAARNKALARHDKEKIRRATVTMYKELAGQSDGV